MKIYITNQSSMVPGIPMIANFIRVDDTMALQEVNFIYVDGKGIATMDDLKTAITQKIVEYYAKSEVTIQAGDIFWQ